MVFWKNKMLSGAQENSRMDQGLKSQMYLRPHTPLYRPSSLSHEDLVLEGEFPFRLPERKGVSCSITILPEGAVLTSYFSPCIHANPFHPAPPLIIIRKNFKKTNDVFSIFFLKMHGIEPLRPNSIVEFAYFLNPCAQSLS